jgi:hypothetical protein
MFYNCALVQTYCIEAHLFPYVGAESSLVQGTKEAGERRERASTSTAERGGDDANSNVFDDRQEQETRKGHINFTLQPS